MDDSIKECGSGLALQVELERWIRRKVNHSSLPAQISFGKGTLQLSAGSLQLRVRQSGTKPHVDPATG